MLVLSIKEGQYVKIGEDIFVKVNRIRDSDRVSIGITAPKELRVDRKELREVQESESK